MTKVESFQDLIAWQRARELTREVYSVTAGSAFRRDWALVDQMRRLAVSVMSNVAEGFERGSAAEFQRFLFIAKGSCAELRSQLFVALDAGFLPLESFTMLQSRAEEVGRILGGLRASVGRRRETPQ